MLIETFHKACSKGFGSLAIALLDEKAVSIEERSGYMRDTALHIACDEGNIGLVEHLLLRGAPVNVFNRSGMSPLHNASCHGFVDIVKLLLCYGADIDLPGDCDMKVTPLWCACRSSRLEVAKELLANGARLQVHIQSIPLHGAGSVDIVRLLLEHGAEVDAKDDRGRNPLHSIVEWTGNLDVIRELVSRGASLESYDNHGNLPIDLAKGKVWLALFREMVSGGASVNWHDRRGRTFLQKAVSLGEIELVTMLLDNGADLDKRSLRIAKRYARYGDSDGEKIVEELLLRQDLKRVAHESATEEIFGYLANEFLKSDQTTK